ncbi:MAG: hypothetical protein QMC90_04745 [Dehalococcoidales bacterium]|nr:hypothetical protein [Dehalococcoidales bacterium]
MPLMRGFTRVVAEAGKNPQIPIPSHIAREAGFKDGQLVEVKLMGPASAQYVMIHKREKAR